MVLSDNGIDKGESIFVNLVSVCFVKYLVTGTFVHSEVYALHSKLVVLLFEG